MHRVWCNLVSLMLSFGKVLDEVESCGGRVVVDAIDFLCQVTVCRIQGRLSLMMSEYAYVYIHRFQNKLSRIIVLSTFNNSSTNSKGSTHGHLS